MPGYVVSGRQVTGRLQAMPLAAPCQPEFVINPSPAMKNLYPPTPQPPSSPSLLPIALTGLLILSWTVHAAFSPHWEESEGLLLPLLQQSPSTLYTLALTVSLLVLASLLLRDTQKQHKPPSPRQGTKHPVQDHPAAPGSSTAGAAPLYKRVFIVNTATQSIPIDVEDICCFFREGGHNFLRTFARCEYLVPQSLSEVQQALDSHQFFRVNRQLIIHRQACQSFRPAAYGKLELTLQPPLPFPAIVSQLKAAHFKRWMQR